MHSKKHDISKDLPELSEAMRNFMNKGKLTQADIKQINIEKRQAKSKRKKQD